MSADILYHYYPFGAFRKILETGRIGFSELTRERDPDAVTYLRETLFEHEDVPARYLYHFFSLPEIDRVLNRTMYFVFCLTEKDDSPYMWRNYGDNGKGVCVGFSTRGLEAWRSEVGVCRLERKYVRMDVFGNMSGPDEVMYRESHEEMMRHLEKRLFSAADDAPILKHASFSHESEYRMVIRTEPVWRDRQSGAVACCANDGLRRSCTGLHSNRREIVRTDGVKTAYLSRLSPEDMTSGSSSSHLDARGADSVSKGYFPVMDVEFDLDMICSLRIGPRCSVGKNELKMLLDENGLVLCDTRVLCSGEMTQEQVDDL